MSQNNLFRFLLAVIFLLLSSSAYAEKIVFIDKSEKVTPNQLIAKYTKIIFYEERFAISIESDDWRSSMEREITLADWDNSQYYFVLYPVRNRNERELSEYGNILKSNKEYLIFETNYEALNNFQPFHNYKMIRLFNRRIRAEYEGTQAVTPKSFIFNSAIQQMVDNVSPDSIWNKIGLLQGMERYTSNPLAINAANYVKDYFHDLGYDTVYFHTWHTGWMPNIVAEKYGKVYPDEIILVGGHIDVYTDGAPGADDNASGSSAILETARVMVNFSYQRTIRFVLFTGEEMGLLGSEAYASMAAQQGMNILGMINMDMIAYVEPGDLIDVDLVWNTPSTALYDSYIAASQLYVPTLSIVNGQLPLGASSDHVSFWYNGFQAIFPFEDSDDYSPYIHTSQDLLGISANNQILAELGTKSVVATLASLAEIAETRFNGHVYASDNLAPIPQAKVYFNGDSVITDSQGYFVTPPLNPGSYELIFNANGFIPDTVNKSIQLYEFITVDAYLIPEGQQRPYIHVESIVLDDDSVGPSLGNNNGISDAGETIEIRINFLNTGNVPASNLSAIAQSNSIWLTITGDSIGAGSVLPGDTTLSANALIIEIDQNTPANTPVQITLDINYDGYTSNSSFNLVIHNRGLFIIIEDDDNAGGLQAYTSALDSLQISYDVGSPDIPQDELSQYNYLIWFCGTDYTSTLTTSDQQKLANYLDDGGKLFINGVDIGYDIGSDPFYGNYLRANYLGDGPFSATTLVTGVAGDPVSGSFASGLYMNDNWVDQVEPVNGSSEIFSYNDGGTDYGCGISYNGDYQLVYLTFTFEHIQNSADRLILMDNIRNWFGVLVDLQKDKISQIFNFSLSPNYPNPFNSETTINFSVVSPQKTTLVIYDVLGRKVNTLINRSLVPGYYHVTWNGKNQLGQDVATGLYFYRLINGSNVKARKLLLIR